MSFAKFNRFFEECDVNSRAAYLRAAQSFINVAKSGNIEDEEEVIKNYASLVKMDASILTKYISALRKKSEYEDAYEEVARLKDYLTQLDLERWAE